MSENTYNKIPSREEIQKMSTPELMEFLRLDSCSPANSASDAELIFYILEVLEAREDAQESAPKQNPKEAFEKFQKLYLNSTEQGVSLDNTSTIKRAERKRVAPLPRWLRSVSLIAATLAFVVIVGSITIKAAGVDPWEMFATWTKDLFFFSSSQTEMPEMPEPDVSDLEEMLEKHSISIPAIPHWLPDGYELADVYEQSSPFATSITAAFVKQKDVLILNLRVYTNASSTAFDEKDDVNVELFETGGNVHYIYFNEGNITASWKLDATDITIYGPVTVDEMKQIIASFYERN